jgi:hypothetical protein
MHTRNFIISKQYILFRFQINAHASMIAYSLSMHMDEYLNV